MPDTASHALVQTFIPRQTIFNIESKSSHYPRPIPQKGLIIDDSCQIDDDVVALEQKLASLIDTQVLLATLQIKTHQKQRDTISH